MTGAELKQAVLCAFRGIDRATESSMEASILLQRAFEASEKTERAHRAMGRRMSPTSGYRHTVSTAACFFVARAVLVGPKSAPTSWLDAASIREDVATGWAVHDWLLLNKPDQLRALALEWRDALEGIDYAKDIAR